MLIEAISLNTMSTAHIHRAYPFLAAFNDIEAFIRSKLDAKSGESFSRLIREAERERYLTTPQAHMLLEFTELRNAISHGAYDHDFEPIAEPNQKTVDQIMALRTLLTNPTAVLDLLPEQKVSVFAPDFLLIEALKKPFSKFPVYEHKIFQGLIVAQDIVTWLKRTKPDYCIDPATTLGEVISASRAPHCCVFLPKNATKVEVMRAMTTPMGKYLPRAGIITEQGTADQKPLRIITPTELAMLVT
ncbi:hypothetical protein GCM10009621_12890 [Corynebacterium felinum]